MRVCTQNLRSTYWEHEGGEQSPRSPPVGGLGGLSGLSARLQAADGDDDDGGALGGGGHSGDDFHNRMSYGWQSAASDRLAGTGIGARMMNGGGRTSVAGEEQERMRRDYEFKIATMQAQITVLERDLEDVQDCEQKWVDGEQRVRTMEQELNKLRRVSTLAGVSCRSVLTTAGVVRGGEEQRNAVIAAGAGDSLRGVGARVGYGCMVATAGQGGDPVFA